MNLGEGLHPSATKRNEIGALTAESPLRALAAPHCLSPLPIDLLWPRGKPATGLAHQVLRDVEQRSRLARRHAAELARAVLSDPAGPAHEPSPPSYLVALAAFAEAIVACPDAAKSFCDFGAHALRPTEAFKAPTDEVRP